MANYTDRLSMIFDVGGSGEVSLDRLNQKTDKMASLATAAVAAWAAWKTVANVIAPAVDKSAELDGYLQSIRSLAAATGRDFGEVMGAMKTQVGGVASELSVASGFLKGLTTELTVSQINKLTSSIRDASVAMGEDFVTQFPLIIKAIKQLNPAILDNIGVTVRLDEVNKRIKDGYYGAGTAINEFTQQNAIYQEILKQTAKYEGQEAALMDTRAGKMKIIRAEYENFQVALGDVISGNAGFASVLDGVIAGLRAGKAALEGAGMALTAFGKIAGPQLRADIGKLADILDIKSIDDFTGKLKWSIGALGASVGLAYVYARSAVESASAAFKYYSGLAKVTVSEVFESFKSGVIALATLFATRDPVIAWDMFNAGLVAASSKAAGEIVQLSAQMVASISEAQAAVEAAKMEFGMAVVFGPENKTPIDTFLPSPEEVAIRGQQVRDIFKGIKDGQTSDAIDGYEDIIAMSEWSAEQRLDNEMHWKLEMGQLTVQEAVAYRNAQMQKIKFSQQADALIGDSARRAVVGTVTQWLDGQIKLRDVFKNIASDFAKYFVQSALTSVAVSLVGSIGGGGILGMISKLFDTPANDRMAADQGSDMASYFIGGALDRFNKANLGQAFAGGLSGGPMLAGGAGGYGNQTIILQVGNGGTEGETLLNKILPRLEEKATRGQTLLVTREKVQELIGIQGGGNYGR